MQVLCGRLHNGVLMPAIGLGTWKLPDTESTTDAVHEALKAGYMHLDCAIVYNNQTRIGDALSRFEESQRAPLMSIPKSEYFENISLQEYYDNYTLPHGKKSENDLKGIFITSKVFTDTYTYEGVINSVEASLKQIGRPIDLMLLHWPVPNTKILSYEQLQDPKLAPIRLECWRALEKVYADGKVRAIGVSNFMEKHLRHLISDIKSRRAAGDVNAMIPMVNQIHISPFCAPRKSLWDIMRRHRILTTAYSTLGPKDQSILTSEKVSAIAARHGRTLYQVVLRWCLQNGYLVIPRSLNPSHLRENAALDFCLDDDAMDEIDALHTGARDGNDPTLLA